MDSTTMDSTSDTASAGAATSAAVLDPRAPLSAVMGGIFEWYNEHTGKETATKERIRGVTQGLESCCREIEAMLLAIHSTPRAECGPILAATRARLAQARGIFEQLKKEVADSEYHRWSFLWRNSVQQLCGQAALVFFLEKGTLMSPKELKEEMLGGIEFEVDVEDYLIGICNLTQELSRLAVNSVVLGDMSSPGSINRFVNEIYNGFRLLTFKNDTLRKRFDGVKYDVKRIEGVVYDLSVRGLLKQQ